jgi:hypothetical protein
MSPLPLVMFEAEASADGFGFAAFYPALLAGHAILMFVMRINTPQYGAHIFVGLALLEQLLKQENHVYHDHHLLLPLGWPQTKIFC